MEPRYRVWSNKYGWIWVRFPPQVARAHPQEARE